MIPDSAHHKTLYLVHHSTLSPAVDGMLAGVLSRELDAEMIPLDTGGGGLGAYEARQHVMASGSLEANGLFWAEWARGSFVTPPLSPHAILQSAAPRLVVPVNGAVSAQVEMAERLMRASTHPAYTLRTIEVIETEAGWSLNGHLPPDVPRDWVRDAYGRPWPTEQITPQFTETIRLLIVGSEHRLRHTYPAVLAALGDAADVSSVGVELSFWDPAEHSETALPETIHATDGILLPGGADMAQVAGQIRVARHALAHDIPLLGLCLGMQTLTTAVAQMRAGFNDANLEELAPHAETKVFRRLSDDDLPGGHRIGVKQMRIVPETRLAQIMGDGPAPIHANHRYVLDPKLRPALEAAGLRVAAWQAEIPLVDAIDIPDQRFCVALQGHPELMTRRGHASPLFRAFLEATRPMVPRANALHA